MRSDGMKEDKTYIVPITASSTTQKVKVLIRSLKHMIAVDYWLPQQAQ